MTITNFPISVVEIDSSTFVGPPGPAGPAGAPGPAGPAGPSGGGGFDGQFVTSFSVVGALGVGTGGVPMIFPFDVELGGVRAVVAAAPNGADVILDVNIDGVTAFTDQADRPKIVDGATLGDSTVPAVIAMSAGARLTIDVDQVGSVDPGEDLNLIIAYVQV